MSVLILGPRGIGKSTVGKILAEDLQLQYMSLDKLRIWNYKEEMEELGIEKFSEEGHLYVVKRTLEDYGDKNSILDFGYVHFFYESEESKGKIIELLKPYENIFLLLPSPEIEESKAILKIMNSYIDNEISSNTIKNANEKILEEEYIKNLAKEIVYTKELEFKEVAIIVKKMLVDRL